MNYSEFLEAKIQYFRAVTVYADSPKALADMSRYVQAVLEYSEAQDKHIEFLMSIIDSVRDTVDEWKREHNAKLGK